MKYYTKTYFETKIHIAEVDPSKGYLVLTKGVGLEPVKDIRHPWIIENKDVLKTPAVAINCSFFNADGSRNGHEMRDASGKWNYAPYGDTWASLEWDGYDLDCLTDNDYNMILDIDKWIVGVGSLVRYGHKDTSKTIVGAVAPRSAIGQTSTSNIIFACTDDRPSGLTVDQMAEIMLDLGCDTAAMLDGGGSSTMVVNGETMNKCNNRPVYDAIQFYSKEKVEVEQTKRANSLIWPVNPSPVSRDFPEEDGRYISSYYGPRETGDGFHDGIDILPMVPFQKGDEVMAAHDGVVVARYFSKSYGNLLIIDGNGFSTLYGHLDNFTVELGQSVKQGEIIGHMGNTGTTGVHLHFEYRDETYTNPRGNYWRSHDGEYNSSQNPLDYIGLLTHDEVKEELADEPNDFVVAYTQEDHDSLVNMAEQMKELADYMLAILEP